MNTAPDPKKVTVENGRSIREVAESLNDPLGDRPAGLLLEECIAANSGAVLSCQGRTFDSAARVLHGILKVREHIERYGKSVTASSPSASENDVSQTGVLPDALTTTGDLSSVSANDLTPVGDDEGEEWPWTGTESGD